MDGNAYLPFVFAALFVASGIFQAATGKSIGEWNYLNDFTESSIKKYSRVSGIVQLVCGVIMAVLCLVFGTGSRLAVTAALLIPVAGAVIAMGICRKKYLERK